MIKIIKIEKGILLWNYVVIEALEDCKKIFGSFLGDRKFYMDKGDRIRLKLLKKDCLFTEGEIVNFGYICNSSTAWQFHWEWNY